MAQVETEAKLAAVAEFFEPQQWDSMVQYDKLQAANIYHNYTTMLSYGFVFVLTVLVAVCGGSAQECGQAEVALSRSGLLPPQYVATLDMRVVGGANVTPHSWPWVAAIFYNSKLKCGAALVHPQIIVTAAHCFAGNGNLDRYHVILGSHAVAVGIRRKIKKAIVHPLFGKVFSRGYDMALVVLDEAVVTDNDKRIDLICLPTVYMAPPRACVVAGWGRIKEGGPPSPVLKQAALPVLANGVCNDWRHYRGRVHATMLCAGYQHGVYDACQGDSGGPLMCVQGGKWELHGVVSWGYGCGRPNKPGVYTRVFSMVGWIRAEMTKFKAEEKRKQLQRVKG